MPEQGVSERIATTIQGYAAAFQSETWTKLMGVFPLEDVSYEHIAQLAVTAAKRGYQVALEMNVQGDHNAVTVLRGPSIT